MKNQLSESRRIINAAAAHIAQREKSRSAVITLQKVKLSRGQELQLDAPLADGPWVSPQWHLQAEWGVCNAGESLSTMLSEANKCSDGTGQLPMFPPYP